MVFVKGKPGYWLGKKRPPFTKEWKEKIGLGASGPNPNKSRGTGPNNPNWTEDRTSLQRYGDDNKDRRSSAYNCWRRQVWLRDNFKCKIANPDCKGRIETHHILSWRDFPELRYQINNGITLCHFHHPRKRKDEEELSPFFQSLVAEMK
jgi:hypothetical protein